MDPLLHMLNSLRLTFQAADKFTDAATRDELLEQAEMAAALALTPPPSVSKLPVAPPLDLTAELLEFYEVAEDGSAREFVDWYNTQRLAEQFLPPSPDPIANIPTLITIPDVEKVAQGAKPSLVTPVAPMPNNWKALPPSELASMAVLDDTEEEDDTE